MQVQFRYIMVTIETGDMNSSLMRKGLFLSAKCKVVEGQ